MKIEKEILYRFFNGTATVEEGEQVKAYLEKSKDNWKEYLSERRLYDTIILKSSTVVGEKQKRMKLYFRKIAIECMKVAAILAIAFFATFYWFSHSDDEGALSTVCTLQGQMANITLPDGTRVWLNSKTKLSYPQTFGQDKRKVQVDGEAYFEVAHHAEKPFVVQTTQAQVEVLGTKFYVESYSDTNEFEAALIEGSVRVSGGRSELVLSPLHKAVLKNGGFVVEKIVDLDTYRWREGLICFKSKPFTELLKEFEKYYGVSIVVDEKKVHNPILTAKFRVSDGVEYALRVLQRDVKFTFTRNDDENRIIIK